MLVRRVARKSRTGTVLGAANRLTLLGRLYGDTDKLAHGYFPFYERHLGRLRLRKQTVYEIGVGGWGSPSPSGSLRVWRDYFVRSTVVGLDIEPKTFHFGDRVKFEQVDQSKVEDLARVVTTHGAPAVVIDDGSHVAAHIWASFEYLWPLLPSGGVYAIEDLTTAYFPSHGGGDPTPPTSAVGLLRELVDAVQALDPGFAMYPGMGSRTTTPRFADVRSVSVYPGIAFVEKD